MLCIEKKKKSVLWFPLLGISSHRSSLPSTSDCLITGVVIPRKEDTDPTVGEAAAVNHINRVFAEREACTALHTSWVLPHCSCLLGQTLFRPACSF